MGFQSDVNQNPLIVSDGTDSEGYKNAIDRVNEILAKLHIHFPAQHAASCFFVSTQSFVYRV